MNKLSFSLCQWQAVPKIIREYTGEYTYKKGIRFMFFEAYVVTDLPPLQLCDPAQKFVTSEGNIFTTESDEQDKMYISNRTRGFEISYHNYEITLKNGVVCVYRYNDDILERVPFEKNTVNQNLKI